MSVATAPTTVANAQAARVGDTVTCPSGPPATLQGPGVPTVLIAGRSAATAGSACMCTAQAGPAPVPSPGSIVVGSQTVRIGGKPAARAGDQASNGGRILSGCATVLIG